MPRTINQIFQRAIEVQDASNLRGVLLSWHNELCDLTRIMGGMDNTECRYLNALYGGKVASLCKCDFTAIGGCETGEWTGDKNIDVFRLAYDFAKKLNEGT